MIDFKEETYHGIDAADVPQFRAHGWMIHHEVQHSTSFGEEFVCRDDWYAAHPDWVCEYHRNGGVWAYID